MKPVLHAEVLLILTIHQLSENTSWHFSLHVCILFISCDYICDSDR